MVERADAAGGDHRQRRGVFEFKKRLEVRAVGQQRTSLDVRAREMRMLDRRGEGGEPGVEMGSPVATGAPAPAGQDANMDDIPF